MALRFVTAGESHGPGLTCIIEGLPAGLALDQDTLNRDMARRQLGHGRGGRMKIERDRADVTGGVRHGLTMGGPIALQIPNRDYANWEERMNPWPVDADVPEVHLPRPGHADLVGTQKYDLTDVRNVLERACARETAARVAGGAVARAFLRALGVEVRSHVIQIGSVLAPGEREEPLTVADFEGVDEDPVRCLDREASRAMVAAHQRPAQGQRVDRRRLRGHRLRARPGARLARLLGGAAGRQDRRRAVLDPGDQGRRAGGGLRPRRQARARRRTTRSSGPRSAATTARRTTPAGSRAA